MNIRSIWKFVIVFSILFFASDVSAQVASQSDFNPMDWRQLQGLRNFLSDIDPALVDIPDFSFTDSTVSGGEMTPEEAGIREIISYYNETGDLRVADDILFITQVTGTLPEIAETYRAPLQKLLGNDSQRATNAQLQEAVENLIHFPGAGALHPKLNFPNMTPASASLDSEVVAYAAASSAQGLDKLRGSLQEMFSSLVNYCAAAKLTPNECTELIRKVVEEGKVPTIDLVKVGNTIRQYETLLEQYRKNLQAVEALLAKAPNDAALLAKASWLRRAISFFELRISALQSLVMGFANMQKNLSLVRWCMATSSCCASIARIVDGLAIRGGGRLSLFVKGKLLNSFRGLLTAGRTGAEAAKRIGQSAGAKLVGKILIIFGLIEAAVDLHAMEQYNQCADFAQKEAIKAVTDGQQALKLGCETSPEAACDKFREVIIPCNVLKDGTGNPIRDIDGTKICLPIPGGFCSGITREGLCEAILQAGGIVNVSVDNMNRVGGRAGQDLPPGLGLETNTCWYRDYTYDEVAKDPSSGEKSQTAKNLELAFAQYCAPGAIRRCEEKERLTAPTPTPSPSPTPTPKPTAPLMPTPTMSPYLPNQYPTPIS